MQRFPRLILLASLALASALAVGCEDENDPRSWVGKLGTDSRRPAAMHQLREIWQSRVGASTNPNDPAVRQFLETSLGPIVRAFIEHREEISVRKDAIEILATCNDPRAVPALMSALEFSPGNTDSERIALRAAQALRALHPQGNTALVQKLVSTIDRAATNTGNAPLIREAVILALGDLGDTSVVQRLREVLKRPIDQQEFRTARAAAQALGALRDPSGIDALVYGLFIRVRTNGVFPYAARAMVHLGANAAVPALIEAFQGQNAEVTMLLTSYTNSPGIAPPPPGTTQNVILDALPGFADRRSIQPLITFCQNRTAVADPQQARALRAKAAGVLAQTVVTLPAQDPERGRAFDVISAMFREEPIGSPDMAMMVADWLVMTGDPRAARMIADRLNDRALRTVDPSTIGYRLGMMSPLARAVRHGDVPIYDAVLATTNTQLETLSHSPDAQDPDSQRQFQQIRAALTTINQVVAVARDCADGQLVCYRGKLSTTDRDVLQKTFRMIAWTLGDNADGRSVLLERANDTDANMRQSIHRAIDAMSPHGCAECVTRLQAVIDGEQGQESKSLMHLDGEFLIARLRGRH